MSQYPCPRCGTEVDEPAGCPACGAPPDPVAAELARLRRQLADLDRRDVALRQEYAVLVRQRQQFRERIDELWGRVPRGVPVGPPPTGTPVAVISRVAPPKPAPSRPETSTRSVQTVLLVLGGILLGVAAVVFTAV
ncbi:MAG TPA: hypothetical protein VHJ83_08915, partial [Micromonosporaceae bacterium]|nr:hypothetical protein [Micromonosporaceae bacterium]